MLDRPHPEAAPERHSDLDIAKAHRAALQGRLVQLRQRRAAIASADEIAAHARAKLVEMGKRELASARTYVDGPVGREPPPIIDQDERRLWTIEVAGNEAQADTLRSAHDGDLDTLIGQVAAELAGVEAEIAALTIRALEADFTAAWRLAAGTAEAVRADLARAFGALVAMEDLAAHLMAGGHVGVAGPIVQRLASLRSAAVLAFLPNADQVRREVPRWRERLEDMAR